MVSLVVAWKKRVALPVAGPSQGAGQSSRASGAREFAPSGICAAIAVLGSQLLCASPADAQVIVNDGRTQSIETQVDTNQVEIGTAGSGTVLVSSGGALNASPATPVPVIQLGTGGTGVLAVAGVGRISGFGLNIGAGGTFDLSNSVLPPGVALSNLSGSGLINVGTRILVVGGDDTNTSFSGRINLEGPSNVDPHGIFTKVGTGTLTIDGATIGGTDANQEGEFVVLRGAIAQTSGTTALTAVVLGLGPATSGALNVSGGALNIDTGLTVGSFNGTGTVTQTGGVVTITQGCGDVARCAGLNIGNQGGSGTYSISDGTLTFEGPGFIILGRNQSTTETTPSTGILNISGGQVSVNQGSVLVGNNTVTAAAQGTGTINQTGGTLTIANAADMYLAGSGNGTYNLSGGTLQIGGTSLKHNYQGQTGTYQFNLGGGSVQVVGSALVTDINATLVGGTTSTIDTNGVGATWSGVLSGDGSLRKAGDGTLVLAANNAYTGGTAIDGGVLAATSDANLGAPTGGLRFGGGTLRLDADFVPSATRAITTNGPGGALDTNGRSLTLSNPISGSGAFGKLGAGTLVLTGNNTYTGGTTISGGTLQVGDGGTSGSIVGDVRNNAALVFNRSDALTLAGAISGTGNVTKLGAGALTLTGASSYSGGTLLKGGQIYVGHSTALGTGSLTMDEGTVLGFASDGLNLANAVVFSGTNDPVIDTGAFTGTLSGGISGNGALTKIGSGTLVLAGANVYTGGTDVSAGTLRAGAANALSAASTHTVAPGATLDSGGFDQRIPALTNNGTVNLAGASAGTALSVTGAYVGNGATLRLGSGGAGTVNRLVMDGPAATASGTTNIQMANLDGLGALTSGDGIEVIGARNGATTTAQTTKSAFALAGGHVDAGAFEYRLYAADAQGEGENWYLRSTTTIVPPDPSGPPVIVPTYRAEVPLLAALPGQVRQADLAMMSNLHRRMGDEVPGSWGAPATQAPSSLAETGTRRAWGRLVYSDLDVQSHGVAQARADMRVSGLQAGTDLLVMDGWRSGVYVGYLDGKSDVSGNARGVTGDVGSNDLRSRFLGAYGTWMNADGWYFDSVLQGSSHRYEIRPNSNPSVSGKASGFMASVEGGKSFALTEGWSLEPQAQLAWQHNSFDDLAIGGARVQQDSSSGWIGRLGVRVKGDLATSAGRFQPYGRLNFYHADFDGDTTIFITPSTSTAVTGDANYSAGEVAAGATLALTSAVSLYGEIGTLWDIGGDATVKSSIQGSLGVKLRW